MVEMALEKCPYLPALIGKNYNFLNSETILILMRGSSEWWHEVRSEFPTQ